MKSFLLQRLHRDVVVTLGQLLDEENTEVAKTLELPWKDNAHDVSSVPRGTYGAHRVLSPKRGYEVFMLDGVPNRSAIEIHIGNVPENTDGCILVGLDFGQLNDEPAVLRSRDAFTKFMNLVAGESNIRITIADPPEITP